MEEAGDVAYYYETVTSEMLVEINAIRDAYEALRSSAWDGAGGLTFLMRVERMRLISELFIRHLESTGEALQAVTESAEPIRDQSERLMPEAGAPGGMLIKVDYGACADAISEIDKVLNQDIVEMEQTLGQAASYADNIHFANVSVTPAKKAVQHAEGELASLKARVTDLVDTTEAWDYASAESFNALADGLGLEFDPLGNLSSNDFAAMVDRLAARELIREILAVADADPNMTPVLRLELDSFLNSVGTDVLTTAVSEGLAMWLQSQATTLRPAMSAASINTGLETGLKGVAVVVEAIDRINRGYHPVVAVQDSLIRGAFVWTGKTLFAAGGATVGTAIAPGPGTAIGKTGGAVVGAYVGGFAYDLFMYTPGRVRRASFCPLGMSVGTMTLPSEISSDSNLYFMPRDMETMPSNGFLGDALRGIWWWLSNPEESGRARMAAMGSI